VLCPVSGSLRPRICDRLPVPPDTPGADGFSDSESASLEIIFKFTVQILCFDSGRGSMWHLSSLKFSDPLALLRKAWRTRTLGLQIGQNGVPATNRAMSRLRPTIMMQGSRFKNSTQEDSSF
jgi:hypothetical protein